MAINAGVQPLYFFVGKRRFRPPAGKSASHPKLLLWCEWQLRPIPATSEVASAFDPWRTLTARRRCQQKERGRSA
jgi:hypothetical protein